MPAVRLDISRAPLLVGLLDDEPAGVISTCNAGVAELEATLDWPPALETRTAVLPLLPDVGGSGVRGSLRESDGTYSTTVHGSLAGFDEDALSAVLDGTLRALVSASGVREAALRTRVSRPFRAHRPESAVIQELARRLWGNGVRVGFGPSWRPAPAGTEITLGCRGARGEISRALGVDRTGGAGGSG